MSTALVVDDDPDIRRLVTYKLEQAGFVVRQAENGEEALASVATSAPDVVLLDINDAGHLRSRGARALAWHPRRRRGSRCCCSPRRPRKLMSSAASKSEPTTHHKPLVPKERSTSASWAFAVSSSTGSRAVVADARQRSSASRPEMPGIMMSRSTTSGAEVAHGRKRLFAVLGLAHDESRLLELVVTEATDRPGRRRRPVRYSWRHLHSTA